MARAPNDDLIGAGYVDCLVVPPFRARHLVAELGCTIGREGPCHPRFSTCEGLPVRPPTLLISRVEPSLRTYQKRPSSDAITAAVRLPFSRCGRLPIRVVRRSLGTRRTAGAEPHNPPTRTVGNPSMRLRFSFAGDAVAIAVKNASLTLSSTGGNPHDLYAVVASSTGSLAYIFPSS